MINFDTIILGGGASGSMCALASKNKNIAIIDKESKIAKKLLVTGNGRCNLTNKFITSGFYNRNIDFYLKRFNHNDSLEFFKNLGLLCYSDEEGRIYPISNSAKSVVSVIENSLNKRNIKYFLENVIQNIEIKKDKFYITTDKNQFSCNKLVVATGKSELLDKLNVKYREFNPSLCSLKTNSTRLLNNIRVHNAKVVGTCNGKQKSDVGEILFKESGISGIALFNISTLFARSGNFKGKIIIDLLPNISKEELNSYLLQRRTLDEVIPNFFDGMFSKEIAYEILNRTKVNENKSSLFLTDDEIERLTYNIKNLDFNVKGYYPNNQVFSGGVNLDDLDENLQHKKFSNLYFCGEICDVDGECGGYNLQWAWTSGYIVGNNI